MNIDSTLNDGVVAAKANKGMIARLQFEQVTEIDPNCVIGWVWLAWTCDSPEQANSHLRKAQKLEPNNETVKKFLEVASTLDQFDPEKGIGPAVVGAQVKPAAAQVKPATQRQQSPASSKTGNQVEASPRKTETQAAKQKPADAKPLGDSPNKDQSPSSHEGQPSTETPTIEFDDGEAAAAAERERAAKAFAFIANKAASVASDGKADSPEAKASVAEQVNATPAPSGASTSNAAKPSEDLEAELHKLTANIEQMQEEIRAETAQQQQPTTTPVAEIIDAPSSSAEEPKGANSGTILIVDDSATVRKIVSMTLETAGYNVISAEDGIEATKILVKSSPNLILLDIKMPRMSGYKLCKLIKAHPDTSSIPVIMLSGKDGVFDKLRGKMVGCNDYISKPFESADLLASVSEHINMFIPQ